MDENTLRLAIEKLADELEAPVFRAAVYEGEHVQGRHEGEDLTRRQIGARLRSLLGGAS